MTLTRLERIKLIRQKAKAMRRHAIKMALRAGPSGAHLGPGNSMAELMATLYCGVMRHDPKNPLWEDRDRFILSKGHGVLGYYTILAESGYFPPKLLDSFETDDSPLAGHPSRHPELGIDISSGSLGHGLSIGVGVALSAKLDKKDFVTYVFIGDGECNEGSIWEAAMSAAHYKLDNLVAIIDRNKLQSDGLSREIMDLGDLAAKWREFGWRTAEIDGHDVGKILEALELKNRPNGAPYAIIAHTTKGKGVSFFENNNAWHHNILSREDAELALRELDSDSDDSE